MENPTDNLAVEACTPSRGAQTRPDPIIPPPTARPPTDRASQPETDADVELRDVFKQLLTESPEKPPAFGRPQQGRVRQEAASGPGRTPSRRNIDPLKRLRNTFDARPRGLGPWAQALKAKEGAQQAVLASGAPHFSGEALVWGPTGASVLLLGASTSSGTFSDFHYGLGTKLTDTLVGVKVFYRMATGRRRASRSDSIIREFQRWRAVTKQAQLLVTGDRAYLVMPRTGVEVFGAVAALSPGKAAGPGGSHRMLVRVVIHNLVVEVSRLHGDGHAHRDIKPENAILDPAQGTAFLADYGMACPTGRRRRSVCGTAQLLAPEILLGAYDAVAADLWSLGATIYELWTGDALIAADAIGGQENAKDKSKALSDAALEALAAFVDAPKADPEIKRLLEALIVVDPTQRRLNLDAHLFPISEADRAEAKTQIKALGIDRTYETMRSELVQGRALLRPAPWSRPSRRGLRPQAIPSLPLGRGRPPTNVAVQGPAPMSPNVPARAQAKCAHQTRRAREHPQT